MTHIINTISCWLITAFVPEYTRLESLTLPQMLNPNQRKSLILTSPQNVATRLYLFLFSTLPNHHHHRHHHVHENHHQHLYLSFPCSLPWQRSLWPRKWSSTHSKSWETLKEWGEKFNFRDFFQKMSIFATFPQPPFYDSCFCCCVFLPWGFSQSLSISSLVWNDHIRPYDVST